MLQIELIDDIRAMHAAAFELLASDPANNTVPLNALGIGMRALEHGEPARGQPMRMALVRRGEAPVALGLVSLGVLLLGATPPPAARVIGAALRGTCELRGIVGLEEAARACAEVDGRPSHDHMRLMLFELTGEPVPGKATGRLELASKDDFELLVQWQEAFEHEARLAMRSEDLRQAVEHRIAGGRGYVWRDPDGRIVSHAGLAFIEPRSARIGPVYTPPELRGRGYAQALVGTLSARLLQLGLHSIFLFTDADNPVSNAVYRRVGFRFIAEHLHLEFDMP